MGPEPELTLDLYEVLGVAPGATHEQIRIAYKRAATETHPDKAPPERRRVFAVRFKQVQQAWDTLSDPDRRAQYDRHRTRGDRAAGRGGSRPKGAAAARPAAGSSGRQVLSHVATEVWKAAAVAGLGLLAHMGDHAVKRAQQLGHQAVDEGAERLKRKLFGEPE